MSDNDELQALLQRIGEQQTDNAPLVLVATLHTETTRDKLSHMPPEWVRFLEGWAADPVTQLVPAVWAALEGRRPCILMIDRDTLPPDVLDRLGTYCAAVCLLEPPTTLH